MNAGLRSFIFYSTDVGNHRKILRVEMINMEEACFIHMESKKEDDHLDTFAMLEAKRSRG